MKNLTKALIAATIVSTSAFAAKLPVLSKDCCVCGKHVHAQSLIQKTIVSIPSAHKNCLKDRTFDENTEWKDMNTFKHNDTVAAVRRAK